MWRGDDYVYTSGVLRAIASNYGHIYDRIEFRPWHIVSEPHSIAEYKADFDTALNKLGRGVWAGECELNNFRYFGRLQRVVIADIYGIDDFALEQMGFYGIGRFKALAYSFMCNILNGKSVGERGRWGNRD